ncbi:peptidase C45 acyl-coenzyme A:6-aminopenicillanic acid acyl-transferase [Purpureocillium lavendulum]|uniref:Peptidase C45 acyl-coenzyme A:6-aminopenicillanic acid acyl-transferase n=1 Tax=Purpureocillium lavendulum TaxID=1247861 RepID=A0AB34FML9_9HYPO|nr:peptidase C45 acyl-coenzyme A:6-aminopenicillanic acid acyl-transferase [Purpureocillium lavendulum]
MGSLAPTNYQHVVVRGPPYERGLSHGQQARAKILASLEHYSQPGKLLPWYVPSHSDATLMLRLYVYGEDQLDVCRRIIREVYIPGVEKFFPEALPEMQGIADGAGVDLDKIVLLNARYDLARVRGAGIRRCPVNEANESSFPLSAVDPVHKGNGNINGKSNGISHPVDINDPSSLDHDLQECTAAGILADATADGSVLLAQNWDMSASVYTNDTALLLEVHPHPDEGVPAMFLVTEAGQLGRSGINAAGLAVCACSLMSTEDYFPLAVEDDDDNDNDNVKTSGDGGGGGGDDAGDGDGGTGYADKSAASSLSRSGRPWAVHQQPLLPMTLMRRQFLHNTNFSNGLINIRNAPRHVSNRLVVGTADNFVLNMEVTPSSVHLAYPYAASSSSSSSGTSTPAGDVPYVVGANHFANPAFHASGWADRNPGGSTWFRDVRVAWGLRRGMGAGGGSKMAMMERGKVASEDGAKSGLLTGKDVTNAFCDHLSAPSSVCQHMEDCTVRGVPDYPYRGRQITLAHVRYDLTRRTATVCKGPPCMGIFGEFSIPAVADC